MTRVLYVASDSEDYLGDSVFHGLRLLLGDQVVDTPRRDPLYADFPQEWRPRQVG